MSHLDFEQDSEGNGGSHKIEHAHLINKVKVLFIKENREKQLVQKIVLHFADGYLGIIQGCKYILMMT